MNNFPSRAPIGLILALMCALVAGAATFTLWRHTQGPLESFYLRSYFKASVMPSHRLMNKQRLTHRYYVLTVNGHFATEDNFPSIMQGVSGRNLELDSTQYCALLRALIYHGQNFPLLVKMPLVIWLGCVLCFLVAGGSYDYRRKKTVREGVLLRGPKLLTRRQFNRQGKGDGLAFQVE